LAASWAFATCVTPTVQAATPVKMVATRIDFLGIDLLFTASISCSRRSYLAGTFTELTVTHAERMRYP
jgi:hypothetical protein